MKTNSAQIPTDLDLECESLVVAMNKFPGIRTVESCCGHGRNKFRIWFDVRSLADLPGLLYWFDGCHSSVYGWRVCVATDCGMSPAFFWAESTSMGKQAYDEADQIAASMENYLERVEAGTWDV